MVRGGGPRVHDFRSLGNCPLTLFLSGHYCLKECANSGSENAVAINLLPLQGLVSKNIPNKSQLGPGLIFCLERTDHLWESRSHVRSS